MPNRRFSIYIPVIFVIADALALLLAAFASRAFVAAPIPFSNFLLYFVFSVASWYALFFVHRLQESTRELDILQHIRRLLVPLTVFIGISFAYALGLVSGIDMETATVFGISFLLFAFAWRIAWYYAIRFYRAKGGNSRKVIILGENAVTKELADHLTKKKAWGYHFLGYKHQILNNSFLNFKDYLESNEIDVIFCYSPAMDEGTLQQVINVAENNLIKVKLISEVNLQGRSNISVDHYGSVSALDVTSLPLDKLANRFLKRSFDILFSAGVILLLLSWLMPILAIMVKLTSRGPVFFRQERHGRNNKCFRIYKLRTMVVHHDNNVQHVSKNDIRVTPIGKFLRKSSLDELPQFFNVFFGHMSIVGPRPHPIKYNNDYKKTIKDRFDQRHAVKPGITGLAQAKGFRGEIKNFGDINGRVRLDKFYVRNWSILMDIKIIILTVISLVKGSEKAY